jgi:GAF domain-containing protein
VTQPLDELGRTLQRVGTLYRELRSAEVAREEDERELRARLVAAERQADRLMHLYVAAYQLHATLDPAEVTSTIADIVTNLLGFERFALLLCAPDGGDCEVALARGLDEAGPFAAGAYRGGDALVDATLCDGALMLGPAPGSEALATVPLAVQGITVGALVLIKLFDHKAMLRPDDRELLDLLAAHAASALFAARAYTNHERRLRTLESLVKLVRGV